MKIIKAFKPNIITPEEADLLKRDLNTNVKLYLGDPAFDHPVVKKIIGVINDTVEVNWNPPAYIRHESRIRNHGWHRDTGSNNHMLWCTYGSSVVLDPSEEAGYLEYREEGSKILAKDHYCGLAIHRSDVEHQTVHSGKRTTFLCFTK